MGDLAQDNCDVLDPKNEPDELPASLAPVSRVLQDPDQTVSPLELEKQPGQSNLLKAETNSEPVANKVFQDVLESDLSCAICQDIYINPLILNCSHTFCKFCVYRWLGKHKHCPTCRMIVSFQAENLALRNIINKMVEKASTIFRTNRTNNVVQRLKDEEQQEKDGSVSRILDKASERPGSSSESDSSVGDVFLSSVMDDDSEEGSVFDADDFLFGEISSSSTDTSEYNPSHPVEVLPGQRTRRTRRHRLDDSDWDDQSDGSFNRFITDFQRETGADANTEHEGDTDEGGEGWEVTLQNIARERAEGRDADANGSFEEPDDEQDITFEIEGESDSSDSSMSDSSEESDSSDESIEDDSFSTSDDDDSLDLGQYMLTEYDPNDTCTTSDTDNSEEPLGDPGNLYRKPPAWFIAENPGLYDDDSSSA